MITLFHDYTSPASWVAVARLQRLADEGLPIAFDGFDAVGVDVDLPVTVDVLAAVEDLQDLAREEGITLRRPRSLPPTARAHVVGDLAERAGLGASWRNTAYEAFWSDGADLNDHATLLSLATLAGLQAGAVAYAIDDIAAVAAVRRQTTEHRRNGVGGVPTLLAQRTLVPALLPLDDLRALAKL